MLTRRLAKALVRVTVAVWLAVAGPLLGETSLESAAEGLSDIPLPESSFAPVQAKRLKNSRVLWVNWDLLREMGIEVPREGLTPEFERRLLDTFAYAIPRPTDSPDRFLEKEKTLYADRYGGTGIGNAMGSGRAAAAGRFQIKGIGVTPLVETVRDGPGPDAGLVERVQTYLSDFIHSHGGLSVSEAVREAIWSELLHKELPYGANRVAVVLSTDLATSFGVANEPRALVVRQNSVRPAHFMGINFLLNRPETREAERERARELVTRLSGVLPPPTGGGAGPGTPRYLGAQLEEAAERMARKFAAEYARSIYHGASSNSNIEIDGKALDFGPMTALHGFPQATYADEEPSGKTLALERWVLVDFIRQVRRFAPAQWRPHLPNMKTLRRKARAAYRDQLDRDFLWLAGTPPELIDRVLSSEEGRSFTKRLQRLARAGNDEPLATNFRIPRHTGTYDLREVLMALTRVDSTPDILAALGAFRSAVRDPGEAKRLKADFDAFVSRLESIARREGISPDRLAEYRRLAIDRRNEPKPHLFRSWAAEALGRVAGHQGGRGLDYDRISSLIESAVGRGAKADRCGSFCVDVEVRRHPESGLLLRRYYDAAEGGYRVRLEAAAGESDANLLGAHVPRGSTVILQGARPTATSWGPEGLTATYPDMPLSEIRRVRWNGGGVDVAAGEPGLLATSAKAAAACGRFFSALGLNS